MINDWDDEMEHYQKSERSNDNELETLLRHVLKTDVTVTKKGEVICVDVKR